MEKKIFKPDWEDISARTLPDWYDDCKLGIFIHWGLYSVPAWAESKWEAGGEGSAVEWFKHNSYAEWYLNTIRIEDSPARKYHEETYGRDFPYEKFAESFLCENWNPDEWAKLFKEAGAGYVVLTTKHHDGYCLYPSRYTDYNTVKSGPKRDLMGDLTDAVRANGLKMGAYFSGLFDWTGHPYAITGEEDFGGVYNKTYAFSDYSLNQAMELVDLYKPSVLWNDIGWPKKGLDDLPHLFAHYYNNVPEGVVDDRWSVSWCDFNTAEYLMGTRSLEKKWEMCRGLGLSFGYNQNENEDTVLSSRDLVRLLVEYVSHNGNLLINIGPKADGTIPDIQIDRLKELGAWLRKHGEAIYKTRMWRDRQHDQLSDCDAFYTRNANDLFVIIDGLHTGIHEIELPFIQDKIKIEVTDEFPVHVKLDNFFVT